MITKVESKYRRTIDDVETDVSMNNLSYNCPNFHKIASAEFVQGSKIYLLL